MQIEIEMMNGQIISLDVSLDKTTVADVKEKVSGKTQIPIDELIILFNGSALKNNSSLISYHIKDNERLQAEKIDSLLYKFQQKIGRSMNNLLESLQGDIEKWSQKFSEESNQKEYLMVNFQQLLDQRKKQTEFIQQPEPAKLQKKEEQYQKMENENATLKALNSKLNLEIIEINFKIKYLEEENKKLTSRMEDFQKAKDELMEKKCEIRGLQKDLEIVNNRGIQTKEISQEYSRQTIKQLENQIQEFKEKNQELKEKNQELEAEIKSELRAQFGQQQKLGEALTKKQTDEKIISDQKQQINILNDQVKELQSTVEETSNYGTVEKIQTYETIISKLNAELRTAQSSFDNSQQQLSQLKKTLFENQKKTTELEKYVETLSYMLKEKEKKVRELDYKIKNLDQDCEEIKKDLQIYQLAQPSANKRSQPGAMEALCKTIKDLFQFDRLPGVTVVPAKFGVIRVEIKQESFESNIENIKRLDIHQDYSVFQEGQWDCIRTEQQFAQGQMKQMFLMKRQANQNELYVIKMPFGNPYISPEAAIIECRSHLISKCLMKKFIRELQEARDNKNRGMKFPEPQYSDFLILRDLKKTNSFWIAERYFNGEFVKYNNNFGFISDANTDINHLAQAFTYYTYFISNFNYMVCGVQGVGNYFTDSALNTKEGSYDETDMGVIGHSMFIKNYEGKRKIGKRFLDLLGIS